MKINLNVKDSGKPKADESEAKLQEIENNTKEVSAEDKTDSIVDEKPKDKEMHRPGNLVSKQDIDKELENNNNEEDKKEDKKSGKKVPENAFLDKLFGYDKKQPKKEEYPKNENSLLNKD